MNKLISCCGQACLKNFGDVVIMERRSKIRKKIADVLHNFHLRMFRAGTLLARGVQSGAVIRIRHGMYAVNDGIVVKYRVEIMSIINIINIVN